MTKRLPSINVPDHVENEQAYIRAAQARIMMNAGVTRAKKFLAKDGAQRAVEFLTQTGEFDFIRDLDGQYVSSHPLVKASIGDFFDKMYQSYVEWNSLTDGQLAAVLKMIDRAAERIEQRKVEAAAKKATAMHIGTVGQRLDLTLTVKHIHSFESVFGVTHIHIMEDAAGNVVVYKGSKFLCDKGETVTLKATIKEHGERDGIKQTIIARPKIAE